MIHIHLKMRYPSLNEFIKSNFNAEDIKVDDTFDLIASCIDQVYSEEESWTQADCTKKELTEFLEQLNSHSSKRLKNSLIQCQNFLIKSK